MKSVFFKNIRIFKLPQSLPDELTSDREAFELMLEDRQFKPVGSHEMTSTGWTTAHEASDQFAHWVENVCLMRLRVESKVLPSAAVKKAVAERASKVEYEQGYKPGRRQMKELKEEVTDELLTKAMTAYRHTSVLIDVPNRLLLIDAGSDPRCDEVVGMLVRDGLPIDRVEERRSVPAMLTDWLGGDEAEAPFSIDMDVKLISTSESKAAVAYKNTLIEHKDAVRHINAGRQCVRMGLTWNDRISFVLTPGPCLKSVKPLDVLRESTDQEFDQQEAFESDLYLFASEAANLVKDLLSLLEDDEDDL